MSAKPPSVPIDPALVALAEARGLTLARVKMPGGHRFFIKDNEGNVLFDGKSFDRVELIGALRGGARP